MDPLILIGIVFIIEAIVLVFLRRTGKATAIPPIIPAISAVSGVALVVVGSLI